MSIFLTILSLVGFIVLTLGTAVFVAAEFSLTALERSTVDAAAAGGDRRSQQVRNAHRTLSFQLSGAQLGITITTLVTGFLAEPVLARLFAPPLRATGLSAGAADGLAIAIALVVATSLSMVLGELVPKNLAIAHPMGVARATAGAQAGFSKVFVWAITGLNAAANGVVRLLGVEPADELGSARTPQELDSLVRNSAEHGALDAATAAVVGRSLRFGELTAEDLMTPRVKVVTLGTADTVADLVAASARTGYSRFPVVVGGDLDETRGFVHVKQAFTLPAAQRTTATLESLATAVPVVPASLDGDELMSRLRVGGIQIALVVDEYGGTAGVVSLEDLTEEIVGDVQDEHDRETADIQRTADGWLCSGLLRTDEVEDALGLRLPDGEFDTLGGLVLSALGRIPDEGDEAALTFVDRDNTPHRWRARIVRMDGRRIDRIALYTQLSSDEPQEPEAGDE